MEGRVRERVYCRHCEGRWTSERQHAASGRAADAHALDAVILSYTCPTAAGFHLHASCSLHFCHWLKSFVFLAFFSLAILRVNMHPVF